MQQKAKKRKGQFQLYCEKHISVEIAPLLKIPAQLVKFANDEMELHCYPVPNTKAELNILIGLTVVNILALKVD